MIPLAVFLKIVSPVTLVISLLCLGLVHGADPEGGRGAARGTELTCCYPHMGDLMILFCLRGD